MFKITEEQIEALRPYLPNIDELAKGDIWDFQDQLDSRMLDFLDKDFEPTPTHTMLERIYDDIHYANPD